MIVSRQDIGARGSEFVGNKREGGGRTVDVLAHRVLVVAGSALVGAGLALLGFVGGILGGVCRRVGLRKDD